MSFVRLPNLPESEISLAAVSATYPEVMNGLQQLGIHVISVNSVSRLDSTIQNHADVVCSHLGGEDILVASGEIQLQQRLAYYDFHVIQSARVFSPYPYDSGLNACRIGNRLIANRKAMCESLKCYCRTNKIEIIPVRQGYAKCSTAVVDEHSIITADQGIAKAAKFAGLDVLSIRPGFIQLPECNYGFIGGTCGKLAKNKLAFAGRIQDHPDFKAILEFLNERKIEPIVLMDAPLTDIGGILPLKYSE